MAEKCALRMSFKDLFIQINKISETFQRRQIQQELILSNQSQMQLKSFLDISMNSSVNLMMSSGEREAALEDIKERSMPQLQDDLSILLERLNGRLMEYFRGEADLLQAMAQERERN